MEDNASRGSGDNIDTGDTRAAGSRRAAGGTRASSGASNKSSRAIKLEIYEEEESVQATSSVVVAPKLVAVDGGYGWMIVLGCFLMHLLLGGWNRYMMHYMLVILSKRGA